MRSVAEIKSKIEAITAEIKTTKTVEARIAKHLAVCALEWVLGLRKEVDVL